VHPPWVLSVRQVGPLQVMGAVQFVREVDVVSAEPMVGDRRSSASSQKPTWSSDRG